MPAPGSGPSASGIDRLKAMWERRRRAATATDVPELDTDFYAPDVLADPYPFYAELRAAGPVVRLTRYGIWATGRHDGVREVLRDHETYSSAAGVGLADLRREDSWRPPSLLLEGDPPSHTAVRRIVAQALSWRAIEQLRERIDAEARTLVGRVVAQ